MGDQRRDDSYDQKAGEREDAEDVEVFLPSAKEAAQPFDGRGVIADALVQQGLTLGKQVVADVHGAARVTGISVGNAAGLTRKLEGEPSGFDFACVGVFGGVRDAQMVVVPGLILHVGEDTAGVLAKN